MARLARRVLPLGSAVLCAAYCASLLAGAGEPCCCQCGCGACQKVCRLVREEKTVSITCWGSKCEDFCLGGPSHINCKHVDEVCTICDDPTKCDNVSSKPKKFVWYDWCPSWAKQHTKTKLMKKVVTKKVPSYKWVVEDLCTECQSRLTPIQTAEGDVVPPPPLPYLQR